MDAWLISVNYPNLACAEVMASCFIDETIVPSSQALLPVIPTVALVSMLIGTIGIIVIVVLFAKKH